MEPWLTRLVPLMRVLALSAVGFGLLVFFVQRWIAFPGAFVDVPRGSPTPPGEGEQVWLDTDFGRVEAWLFRAAGPGPHPAVVYAHGNGELIDHWALEMRDMAAAGVTAMAVEFPGYGFSDGKPTRETIRRTFLAAYDALAARPDIDPTRIIAWGRSMGGGAAGDLSSHRPVAALILQSTFSSTMDAARAMLMPGFLVRDRFDNAGAVRDFEGPVLLMHGLADEVLPYAHAERIASVRSELQVTRIDCGHNDCGRIWPEIRDEVLGFLQGAELLGPGGVGDAGPADGDPEERGRGTP